MKTRVERILVACLATVLPALIAAHGIMALLHVLLGGDGGREAVTVTIAILTVGLIHSLVPSGRLQLPSWQLSIRAHHP